MTLVFTVSIVVSVTRVRKAIIRKASYKILYGSVCNQGESITLSWFVQS